MITVVGEALIDLVESPDGSSTAHPGGSPANVAVGLGRLGHQVALLTRYGRDAHGSQLAAHLAASEVALVGEPVDELPTSVAVAHMDASGAAHYEFAISWRLPDRAQLDLSRSLCLHTGSIAATLMPGAADVRRLVEQARGQHCTVSYDPNCRPSLMEAPELTRPRIEALVALADVVKVSDEDLSWLHPGRDAAEVAREWLASGPAVVVVTRGGAGSLGVCAAGSVERPAVPVTVVDTVGAGDAFTSGLLDALHRRGLLGPQAAERLRALPVGQLDAVLREASLVSAVTCGRPGADPPTAAELAAFTAELLADRG